MSYMFVYPLGYLFLVQVLAIEMSSNLKHADAETPAMYLSIR